MNSNSARIFLLVVFLSLSLPCSSLYRPGWASTDSHRTTVLDCYLCAAASPSEHHHHHLHLCSLFHHFLERKNFAIPNSKSSLEMSDFPYQHQHHHSLLDSIFLPNTPIIKNVSMEDANLSAIHFSQFHRPEPLYEDPLDVSFHEGGHNICHCSKIAAGDSETSVTKKQNTDSSTVVADRLESGEQITQNVSSLMKKRQNANGSSWNSSAQSKDDRDKKSKKQKKSDGEMNKEEKKPKSETKDQKKIPEEASTGYIHVRARRGEATDSHSLAERARRQKISERMKMLQGLVPGCDKVTGKAQMLDEIINYVQYLQNQVEFLSMKLASVNPLFYDIGMELDPFAIGPERLSSLQASTLPGVEQCSPTQATAFAVANTIAAAARPGNSVTANNYPVVDCAAALLLQGHEDSGLWDEDEQRQKLINPSGFSGNWSSF